MLRLVTGRIGSGKTTRIYNEIGNSVEQGREVTLIVPEQYSFHTEKKMLELKKDSSGKGHCFPCMGCRSFLSPYDENPDKYYGRFNKGVVTINLVDAACSSKKNLNNF